MEPERRSHSPRHHRHHSRSPRRRWLPLKPIVHCQRSLYVLTTKIYVPLFKYTFTFNNHNYYVYTHISNNYYTLYKYTVLVLVEGVVVGAILLIETGAGHLDIAGQEEEGVVNCSLVQFPVSSPLSSCSYSRSPVRHDRYSRRSPSPYSHRFVQPYALPILYLIHLV